MQILTSCLIVSIAVMDFVSVDAAAGIVEYRPR
jgi:hypothetical protein